ncbi:MAG: Gfo/Idh/MocA family oxidoreductase [Roseobacter sp.]|jgi:predicted dehydrogenase|nr:Gfo/Idh/MocA family oxidoreductase [Roseobacter sp.]
MINVAIIGAGIGTQHLDAYLELPSDYNVLYIIDKDLDRAVRAVENHNIDTAGTIDIALNDPRVDLIDICLPPYAHVAFCIMALEAGKHVICEKPLATSLADAIRVKQVAERTARQVFPIFQYRWGAPIAQLKALIASGLTGRPQVASVETHWSRDATYYSTSWRGTWGGEQGGAVLCHAIHAHDLICHMMGRVKSLSSFTATRMHDIETEDCAAIIFDLQNGALATSNVTLGAATNETRLRFVYEHITVTSGTSPYCPGDAPWVFEARSADLKPEMVAVMNNCAAPKTGFAGMFQDISRALDNKPNAAVTLEEGIDAVELVTAIYHAARSGERVDLPLSAHHPLYGGWVP